MKICDSSYLIAFLHPNPNPPMDRQGKPVTQFRERISTLIEELSAANDVIGVPTPALAETLVRSGPNRAQYMKVLGDSWKFQMVPFDARAAIEAAELIAAVKTNKEKWDTWAKVKFDIQIVSIAKAESATIIYSDDQHIENLAKRLKIRVIRICDLPLPPPKEDKPIEAGPIGSQGQLPLGPPTEETPEQPAVSNTNPAPEAKADAAIKEAVALPSGDGEQPESTTTENNQLQTNSADPSTISGGDGGRTQGETAGEASEKQKD